MTKQTKTEERTGRNIVAKGDKDFYFDGKNVPVEHTRAYGCDVKY